MQLLKFPFVLLHCAAEMLCQILDADSGKRISAHPISGGCAPLQG